VTQLSSVEATPPSQKRQWQTPVVVAESLSDKTNSKNGFVSETHIGCVANCTGPTS
jgi:hypothetical protein